MPYGTVQHIRHANHAVVFSLRMRFRRKFGVLSLVNLAVACFLLADRYHRPGHHQNGFGFAGAALVLDPISRFATWAWAYWTVEPSCLCERRFWMETEIPWTEITRVGPAYPNRKLSSVIAVYYARFGPSSKLEKMVIDPEDEAGLLAELQKYAPQAAFDGPTRILA